jgi:hypothetical protein
MMHTIKMNGGLFVVHHQRLWAEIHQRPHICGWKGRGDDGEPISMWAVYYLLGKQSRIRCNLHTHLRDAIKQARYVYESNQRTRRT